MLRILVLLLMVRVSEALLAGGTLTKVLSGSSRPLIVHVWDANPDALESYAIDDVSEACREAGATAVLAAPALIGSIWKEQEKSLGAFPGPLPVIADCALLGFDSEICEGAKTLGASAIGIRYYSGDWTEEGALEEALQAAVGTAESSGLGAVLLAEFGADGDEGAEGAVALASSVGAAAGLGKGTKEEGEDCGALALGCWDGSMDGLKQLRESGYEALVLKNSCRGNVAWGAKTKSPSLAALALTKLIKAALSKGSNTIWGGAGGQFIESQGPTMESYLNRDDQPGKVR